ncbi:hypothetical protein FKM82_025270 [Ascaphus truei]
MEKKKMEAAILQADQSLSKREKQVEESRIQRETAEQKTEIEKEKNICLEQTKKEQMRGFEQQMLMLKEKLEQDRLKMLKENERLMEDRKKEKQDLLRDGLTNKAAMREQQIQELKKQNDETSSNSWITKGICLLADVASLVLPGVYGKAAVFASNLLKRIF